MPNLAAVMKDEIRRLARKEIKAETAIAKRSVAQHRKDITELKRQVNKDCRPVPIKTSLSRCMLHDTRFHWKEFWLERARGHNQPLVPVVATLRGPVLLCAVPARV